MDAVARRARASCGADVGGESPVLGADVGGEVLRAEVAAADGQTGALSVRAILGREVNP